MAQFDVHRNLGRERHSAPYLLVVQSARFDRAISRVVVPLILTGAFPRRDEQFNAEFVIEGVQVVIDPLQTLAVLGSRLGPKVANLADQGDTIIAALDLLISRAHG